MPRTLSAAPMLKSKRCSLKSALVSLTWFFTAWLVFAPNIAAQNSDRAAAKLSESNPLDQFNSSVRTLVKRVKPSVVQVRVTGYGPVEDSRSTTSLVLGKQESLGSGVIIDPDGYIVTNAHVVRGANHVQVNISTMTNEEAPVVIGRGRTLDARIIGLDSEIDLALLKVDAGGLRALPMGNYNKLRQGDIVFAFGSPEGLQDSVTMGVVSAAARQPDPDSPMIFVQSDAAINPGSSGGPLVNVNGELVGINTYILSESGGNEGLGFAIPSAIVAFAYPQLRKNGHVHRGESGITVQAITPGLAAGLNLQTDWGVIISDVAPGSPAEDAGLEVQDIITSIDSIPVENLPSLETRLFMRRGGERIKLGVLRGAKNLSFEVLVVELPHDSDNLAVQIDPVKNLVSKLGIVAVEVDAGTMGSLSDLRIASGVIVAAKAADSKLDISLTTGDVIHNINGTPIKTIDGLRSTLDHLNPNGSVVLQVERNGKLMFLSFKLDRNY